VATVSHHLCELYPLFRWGHLQCEDDRNIIFLLLGGGPVEGWTMSLDGTVTMSDASELRCQLELWTSNRRHDLPRPRTFSYIANNRREGSLQALSSKEFTNPYSPNPRSPVWAKLPSDYSSFSPCTKAGTKYIWESPRKFKLQPNWGSTIHRLGEDYLDHFQGPNTQPLDSRSTLVRIVLLYLQVTD